MDYNRLFYMNITYSCNNRCVFCISHNTQNHSKEVTNPIILIQNANTKYHFDNKDIFVINGGEPTLSSDFDLILTYLIKLECKIIVYTNGRLLKNYNSYFNNSNIYWIVPFYGLEENHDKYTGVAGAYLETLSSLRNIQNKNNISIKFLIHKEEQLEDFFRLAEILKPDIKEIHISFILNNNFSHRYHLAEKIKDLICYIQNNFILKLSNIPLCQLKMDFNLSSIQINRIKEYYYIAENNDVKKINYDKDHKWNENCELCKLLAICCDTYKKYRVLKIDKSIISLEEE